MPKTIEHIISGGMGSLSLFEQQGRRYEFSTTVPDLDDQICLVDLYSREDFKVSEA